MQLGILGMVIFFQARGACIYLKNDARNIISV